MFTKKNAILFGAIVVLCVPAADAADSVMRLKNTKQCKSRIVQTDISLSLAGKSREELIQEFNTLENSCAACLTRTGCPLVTPIVSGPLLQIFCGEWMASGGVNIWLAAMLAWGGGLNYVEQKVQTQRDRLHAALKKKQE